MLMSDFLKQRILDTITSRFLCLKTGNEHDLALENIPVLHLDVIPYTLLPFAWGTRNV